MYSGMLRQKQNFNLVENNPEEEGNKIASQAISHLLPVYRI